MEPIPIPDETRHRGEAMGWRHLVIEGPPSEPSIIPVEAMVGFAKTPDGHVTPELNVVIQISEEDRAALEKGGWKFWLSFAGHITPFSMEVFDPDEALGPAAAQGDN